MFLKPESKKMISFVKFIVTDVGNFYTLNISYLKQDVMMQGMQPSHHHHAHHQQNMPYTPHSSNINSTTGITDSPFKMDPYDPDEASFIA